MLQQDHSDCGVACLLSLVRFYAGEGELEHIRNISGTNSQGTTLLGLEQASRDLGFDAEGCSADISSLIAHDTPVILHVIIDGNLHHYVVCYGYKEGHFIIGDPSRGIRVITNTELDRIWVSKTCLTLVPNNSFLSKKENDRSKVVWIKTLLKKDIQILTTSAALGVGIAILGLSMAIFQKKLIDSILPDKNVESLIIGVFALGILLLLKSGLSALRSSLIIDQSRQFNVRIARDFLTRLFYLPKPFFDSRKVGDFVARLNDASRIQRVISKLVGSTIIDIIIAIVTIGFLFFFSWKIACVAMSGMSLYFILLYKYNSEIVRAQKSVMGDYASNESKYIDSIGGIADIKSYDRYDDFVKNNLSVFSQFQTSIFNLGHINIKLSFVAGIVSMLILLTILAMGSMQVIHGQLALGSLIAIIGVVVTLLASVGNLAMVSIPLNEAKVAFDRMFAFSADNEIDTNPRKTLSAVHSISVTRLAFSFRGRSPLFEDISIELDRGTITTLLGESGSGKSTLLQILHQFYPPSSGNVVVNNSLDLQIIETNSWSNLVSYLPQNVHIFNGPVLSNITLTEDHEDWKEAIDLCDSYGLSKLISSFPQGFKTIVGEGGVNISGGQRQVLALARALYHKPDVLLLDEATSAMDRKTETYVLNLLQDLKKNMIIFMVTHQLKLARKSDYIYILEDRKTLTHGTPSSLLHSENFYSEGIREFAID